MRAYKVSVATEEQDGNGVSALITHTQFAGSMAEVRTIRDTFVEELGVKKKDVDVEEVDIPTSKTELLPFLNNLMKGEQE
jgi:hypothetical protein